MTPKNIALEPELLEQVGKLAQEEGKTADELANELLGPLLEIRKASGGKRSQVAAVPGLRARAG